MKRQGDNITDQPPVKKPDVSVSTDLRSKIGAKLQTLLNGITTDSRLYARSRRHLYEDLFGETQHSEIIIDPTIVIKTEAPEVEECSNDSATLLASQNFLVSAKSRLTELLNKQQAGANKFKENEKENTLSSNKCNSSSPDKSNSFHNQASYKSHNSCNSLNKKRKNSSSREYSNSSSDAVASQVCLKNLVVVVEDIMNSKNRTKFTHLLPTKHPDSHSNLTNVESSSVNEQGHVVAKDNIINEVADSVVSNKTDLCVDGRSTISQSNSDSQVAPGCYVSENNSELNVFTSKSPQSSGSFLLNDVSPSNVIHLAEVLLDTEENTNHIAYSNEDDSEFVDDPTIPQVIVDITVGESISSDCNLNLNTENPEPDVVLLCVKRPTHEVITLEDGDDSDDVVEEVHECEQCGKAFRAKSLLNFHIRMHGNDLSTSPSSSSHSFS